MDRFSRVKDYVSGISRTAWLALGLILIAVLIAATFAFGDTSDVANQEDNGEVSEQEEQVNGEKVNNEEGEEVAGTSEEDETVEEEGNENESEEQEEGQPSQLADTGPVAPLAAAFMLGSSGYLYRRSRKNVDRARKE